MRKYLKCNSDVVMPADVGFVYNPIEVYLINEIIEVYNSHAKKRQLSSVIASFKVLKYIYSL